MRFVKRVTRPWRSRLAKTAPVVSSESERLVLVDSNDEVIGYGSKGDLHDGAGTLHRAFSLFIFNSEGQLLMQQRSDDKRLWPLFWSNSCCSHPREGEEMDGAIHRRLREELGMESELHFLFRFRYHAQFGDLGAEHEFCWVYAGVSDDAVQVNPNEVASWKWIDIDELEADMAERPEVYTPWFRMEWERIRQNHNDKLTELLAQQPA
ncbi:MAG: isopentenyl-diphosphate Delta-isomerase [Gammaproteobacteria bacterium]|nr:isopentenyl-diphosphate Delta-isomerase [Gammaproteobacteria bacterium]